MFDSKLLDILCCPETKQRLRLAVAAELVAVNSGITSGKLLNRAGRSVTGSIAEALVSEDGIRLYPIVDGIPVMLLDESILLK